VLGTSCVLENEQETCICIAVDRYVDLCLTACVNVATHNWCFWLFDCLRIYRCCWSWLAFSIYPITACVTLTVTGKNITCNCNSNFNWKTITGITLVHNAFLNTWTMGIDVPTRSPRNDPPPGVWHGGILASSRPAPIYRVPEGHPDRHPGTIDHRTSQQIHADCIYDRRRRRALTVCVFPSCTGRVVRSWLAGPCRVTCDLCLCYA